jgi:glycosyltransferase involved in cell wall biosynthesis
MPERVSLCVIARDEEVNLPRCLLSVASLVHEIVVVDTGSRDGTREVAMAQGARVFDFAWADDFAAARNESVHHATGDWILWLDGDEWLAHDQSVKLRTLLAGLTHENAAFVMKQRSAMPQASGSATVVDQVRLFRNDPEIRWRYRVHEQILPALRAARHDIRFTDIFVEHTGYQDPALLRRKTERNLRLLHLQEAENPDDRFTLFNLGWVYQDLGQPGRSLPYLRRSLALCQAGDSIVRKLYVLISQAKSALGQHPEALAACRAGVARCPDDDELLFLEGRLLREQGYPAAAEECLRRLLQRETGPHFGSVDAGIRGYNARHQLAVACWEQGHAAEAEEAWQAVLAEQPGFLPAWQGLGEVYLVQGRWTELDQACECMRGGRPQAAAPVPGRQRCPAIGASPAAAIAAPSVNGNHLGKDRLRLAFASFSPFDFNIDTPYRQPLGGSESALCYLAEALAQRGHDVFLLNTNALPTLCRGVRCLRLSAASIRQLGALDAFIVQNLAGRGLELRTLLHSHTPLVFWSQHAHDQPAVQALRDPAERQAYDHFVLVSDWQRQQYFQHFALDPERTVVLRNAIGPGFTGLYPDKVAILRQKTMPPVLAYTSTPFRGLDVLLDAFPSIRRAVPGVTLKVFSSMQVYQMAAAEDLARYGALYQRCRTIDGVEYAGSLPQPELAHCLRTASVLAYPNTFAETSCIAVLEALAAGCLVITSDLGALAETAAGFARLIPSIENLAEYRSRFVEEVVQALRSLVQEPSETEDQMRRQVDYLNQMATWPIRAQEWLQLFRRVERHSR